MQSNDHRRAPNRAEESAAAIDRSRKDRGENHDEKDIEGRLFREWTSIA